MRGKIRLAAFEHADLRAAHASSDMPNALPRARLRPGRRARVSSSPAISVQKTSISHTSDSYKYHTINYNL